MKKTKRKVKTVNNDELTHHEKFFNAKNNNQSLNLVTGFADPSYLYRTSTKIHIETGLGVRQLNGFKSIHTN